MPRQLALFLTAVQFLTRVPTPVLKGYQPDWTARSARYFPLVGAMVGGVGAAVLAGASLAWGGLLPALLAVGAGVLLTGAFHEDGLADTADGLGGGQTPARRLEIMKDSRIGTFGALALGLVLAVKVAALGEAPVGLAAAGLVAAHGGGRAAAVLAMRMSSYGGDRAWAKVKPVADGVTAGEAAVALAFGGLALIPVLVMAPWAALSGLALATVAATAMALLAKRLIGGWVGDTLGATEQVFEAAFLAGFVALIA